MVPPVPTPATSTSALPSVSSQISGPVVFSWMAGLAGLLNCWGRKYFSGSPAASSSAVRTAPFMPSARRGKDQIRPEELQHLAPLQAHGLGHGEGQLVAPGRADEGQSDAGVAAGGLDHLGVGLDQPFFLRVPDHGRPDPALDRIGGVAPLDLGEDAWPWSCPVTRLQPHQRGAGRWTASCRRRWSPCMGSLPTSAADAPRAPGRGRR